MLFDPIPRSGKVPRGKKHYIERTVRMHTEYLSRLDQLAPWLESQADLAPDGVLKAGERLRLALCIGIEALERKKQEA